MLKQILLLTSLCGAAITGLCKDAAIIDNTSEDDAMIIDNTSKPDKEISLSLKDALMMALEGNRALKVRRLKPDITKTNEEIQWAGFDPTFSAGVSHATNKARKVDDSRRSAQDLQADATLSKKLTSGGKIEFGVEAERDESTELSVDHRRHADSLGLEFKITQSLLEGRGSDVTLAGVKKAEINTKISKQELRRYIETLVFNVSNAYWDLVLKQKQLSIYHGSYDLAREHQREVEIFIENGKEAEIEQATVEGEVSSRREKLITAQGDISKRRYTLLNFLNYGNLTPQAWSTEITPTDMPDKLLHEIDDVNKYVEIAIKKRPEIREAELRIEREEIDLVVTQNGLLPKLDFFVALGRTDYSNSFKSYDDTSSDNNYVKVGLDFSMAIGGRADEARHERNLLEHKNEIYAMDNLERVIALEVRKAYIDCKTGLETIDAVKVTRDLRQQSLNTQTIKFELGKATNLDIANSQRDLLESQIKYTEAMINYIKARIKLHYLDGSLIERSGLDVEMF